jgi:hypothetical protein
VALLSKQLADLKALNQATQIALREFQAKNDSVARR